MYRSLAAVMAPELAPSPPPRLDHATLLAAGPSGKGDRVAHREACKRVLAQVYRVVAAVLGPRSADVADVAQEAFVRVYHGVERFVFDPARPAGPGAWVNKIALRTALDHRKGRGAWAVSAGDAVESAGGDFDDDELGGPVDRAVLAAALLNRLDERHRAILILHYWNGETQEEIAETLGLPVGTVKTRMRAAHQRIREAVMEQGAAGQDVLEGEGAVSR